MFKEGANVRFLVFLSRCSEPSFGRRVLTATELPRAVARTGRSFHLGNLWRRGGDSNSRYRQAVQQISSLPHSTTLPPLHNVRQRSGCLTFRRKSVVKG